MQVFTVLWNHNDSSIFLLNTDNQTIMIGEKIKKIHQNSRMTWKEFAEILGTTESNLRHIYKKEHIDTKYLIAICEHFDIPITYFFEESISNKSFPDREPWKGRVEELKKEKERLYTMLENLTKAYTQLAGKLEGTSDFLHLQLVPYSKVA